MCIPSFHAVAGDDEKVVLLLHAAAFVAAAEDALATSWAAPCHHWQTTRAKQETEPGDPTQQAWTQEK